MHGFAVTCVLLVGACSFKADYTGQYTCTDDLCPNGLTCNADKMCVEPPMKDASGSDAMPDGRPNAQTCADPQPFPAAGGTTMGTTAGKNARVSSMCGGLVFNGPEAVYKIATTAGAHLLVTITGARKAYVLATCQEIPQTPTCEGNMFAKDMTPISVIPNPGTQYVVVDDDIAGASGAFTLTLSFQ